MARYRQPTLPDDKIDRYRERLYRELSNLFEWQGMPEGIPLDYLERTLVRNGSVLFYYKEDLGFDCLACTTSGHNRHNLPTMARTYSPNTDGTAYTVERKIAWLSSGTDKLDNFDENTHGVLIYNMEYGQSHKQIVDDYATRLALVKQATDTNIFYANIPYIFLSDSDEMTLSIRSLFESVYDGEPYIIGDKRMFVDNKDRSGVPTGMTLPIKELLDIENEMLLKFRQECGFDSAGVDKAERVNTLEITTNQQATRSVLSIMLSQRQKAADTINKLFGTNIKVTRVGDADSSQAPVIQPSQVENNDPEEGDEENG